jgi:hypothetical protein
MRMLAARLLLPHNCMQAKSHIGTRAGPFLTDTGYFFADNGYWKAAIIIIGVVFLMMLLITQFGKAASLGRGAEVAFSRALQLLHEADNANRNVRPLPLSLVEVRVRASSPGPAKGREASHHIGETGKSAGGRKPREQFVSA